METEIFRAMRVNRILKAHSKRCAYCGLIFHSSDEKTIDHIGPKKYGGPETGYNKVVCCKKCNQEKGCVKLKDFKKTMDKEKLKEYLDDFGNLQLPDGRHYAKSLYKRFKL